MAAAGVKTFPCFFCHLREEKKGAYVHNSFLMATGINQRRETDEWECIQIKGPLTKMPGFFNQGLRFLRKISLL